MHVKKVYFSSPKALSLLDEGADVAVAHGLAPEHGGQVLDDFFIFFILIFRSLIHPYLIMLFYIMNPWPRSAPWTSPRSQSPITCPF